MLNFTLIILVKLKNLFLRLFNIKTFGVRALIIQRNEILLIKHSYSVGWYTVGGGVDRNESPRKAIERELFEEVGVIVNMPPKLFGIYHNKVNNRDDYVALYIVEKFSLIEKNCPEIADKKWFSLDDVPEEASSATKRRIEEYLGKKEQLDQW